MRRTLLSVLILALLASPAWPQQNVSSWSGPLSGELNVFNVGEPGFAGEQRFEISFAGPEMTLKLTNGTSSQIAQRTGAGIGAQAISGEGGSQCLLLAYIDESGKEKLIIAGQQTFIDYLVQQAGAQNKPEQHENAGAAGFALIEFASRDWEQLRFE